MIGPSAVRGSIRMLGKESRERTVLVQVGCQIISPVPFSREQGELTATDATEVNLDHDLAMLHLRQRDILDDNLLVASAR
jgi:hypothetical protein